jgi:2-(3-amino-3-carboxypropyl)histidine synthase
MKPKNLQDLEERYELELDRVVSEIKKQKPSKVLLQFPDGLKPYATQIQEKIKKELGNKNKTDILIYMDTCFGACDIPLESSSLGVDLIVQFGHSAWDYSKRKDIKVLS